MGDGGLKGGGVWVEFQPARERTVTQSRQVKGIDVLTFSETDASFFLMVYLFPPVEVQPAYGLRLLSPSCRPFYCLAGDGIQ